MNDRRIATGAVAVNAAEQIFDLPEEGIEEVRIAAELFELAHSATPLDAEWTRSKRSNPRHHPLMGLRAIARIVRDEGAGWLK